MKSMNNWSRLIWFTLVLITIFSSGLCFYLYRQLKQERLHLLSTKTDLEKQLILARSDLATTTAALQIEKNRNDTFSEQLSGLATTVGTLDKLSKTDRELLKKYSKIYFLNENYVPSNLATITSIYLYNSKQSQKIHTNIWPKLESLILSASSSGVTLQIDSAYRSFGTQAALKTRYLISYGSGANKFSADQGYSEHQLGTTVDFGTPSIKGDFSKFSQTSAFSWLVTNAYRYGFILSYPKDNGYYQYEPWHWRYVGVALATKLHEENKYFYDLTQRTIDQYLVNIFD